MGIDTIRLVSPMIERADACTIESRLGYVMRVDPDGELGYRIASGSQKASFESTINITIRDYVWVRLLGEKRPVKMMSLPYLVIEFSLPKTVLGYNGLASVQNEIYEIEVILKNLSFQLGVTFPHIDLWRVDRIDYGTNVIHDYPIEFIRAMQGAIYPRRAMRSYDTSVMWASRLSSVKFYHKSTEQINNDKRRLVANFGRKWFEKYISLTNNVVRIEVTMRKMKIKTDEINLLQLHHPKIVSDMLFEPDGCYHLAGSPCLDEKLILSASDYLADEVSKLLREQRAGSKMVSTSYDDVSLLLAGKPHLLAYWLDASRGNPTRGRSRATHYRLRSQLAQMGISTVISDVSRPLGATDLRLELSKNYDTFTLSAVA